MQLKTSHWAADFLERPPVGPLAIFAQKHTECIPARRNQSGARLKPSRSNWNSNTHSRFQIHNSPFRSRRRLAPLEAFALQLRLEHAFQIPDSQFQIAIPSTPRSSESLRAPTETRTRIPDSRFTIPNCDPVDASLV